MPTSENLLIGIDGVDDAGVYRLDDNTALVQTVDFFPPIVDDPFVFGQVAAANALSDVYAMGGKPLTALNILCFPAKMDITVAGQILRGGADKISEAGAVIVGGHSIKDNEIKYGLAVTGLIHPDKIMTNSKAQPGDILILTKPIGTGIVSTAVKQNKVGRDETEAIIKSMTGLNKTASEVLEKYGAHAVTDVTGFGLAGHAFEMASASKVSLEIDFEAVPLLPGTIKFAEGGALTGGGGANRKYLEKNVAFASHHSPVVYDIIYDAQTSGGLLVALSQEQATGYIAYLQENGIDARAIGRITEKREKVIYIN